MLQVSSRAALIKLNLISELDRLEDQGALGRRVHTRVFDPVKNTLYKIFSNIRIPLEYPMNKFLEYWVSPCATFHVVQLPFSVKIRESTTNNGPSLGYRLDNNL